MIRSPLHRRLVALAGALLCPALLAGQSSLGGATPSYHPGIDVLHYDLALVLPDTGREITGRAELTVSRTAAVDTLWLDLRALRVDTVRVGGRAVPFARTGERVGVPLPAGAGDTLQVAVHYGGAPADGLIIRTDSATGRWTAFGDNWPNRARFWIPSVDHPSDKATVAWTVIAPGTRRVVANGTLLEETPLPVARGAVPRVRTRWRTDRPIPTYLMVIGAAPLAHVPLGPTACGLAERPGCVAQSVWVDPAQRAFVPGPFEHARDITEYFARLVAPFPYERLDHVQSSTRFGGMENATVIFYSDGGFRRGTLRPGLIAHETAHQWFGNAVTPRDWPHLWLSEGFATYFEQLWHAHVRGDSAFRRGMAELRRQITASPVSASRPVLDTAQTDLLELLNTNSYQKGAWVLHMLRRQVGDSAFFRGLRDYYAANRHGTATTAELRRALEAASGEELGWFFDQWLRRPGWPEVRAEWRYDPERRRVVLVVEQGERFGPFRFPLTVEVVDAAGTVRRATVPVEARPAQGLVVPLDLTGPPRSVTLDPDVDLLATVSMR